MKYRSLQAVLLLSIVALCSSALSKHYYIVPINSTDSACQDYQNGTCFTLEQLAQSDLTSAGGTNLTLSFLPGEHLLTQSLAICNFSHIQINGMSESMVSFHGRNRIEISHSDELSIEHLDFVHHMRQKPATKVASWNQPQGLAISNTGNVYINNCSFVGMDNRQLNPDHNISAVKISGARSITLDRLTARGNYGRVVYIELSCDVTILKSEFSENIGDVVYVISNERLHLSILYTSFTHNDGASSGGRALALHSTAEKSALSLNSSEFINNSALGIQSIGVNNVTVQLSNFTNNEDSIFHLQQSTVTFLSGNLFSKNNGSVYAFDCEVTFEGPATISNNYHLAPIYAVQSQIHFNSPEGITITNNTASLGGGIYLRESTMTVSHPIEISQNTADYGGGIYAFLSSIESTSEKVNNHIMITNNNVSQSGGGICAIASTIKTYRALVNIDLNTALVNGGGIYASASTIKISRSHVTLDSNTASFNGGGMYLKEGSKLYLLEIEARTNVEIFLKICNNNAQYGGGIFVSDWYPNIDVDNIWYTKFNADYYLKANNPICEGKSPSGGTYDCFLQTLYLNKLTAPNHGTLVNTLLSNNTATKSGAAIFGGLLDRCTISSSQFLNGLDYIHKTVAFTANTNFTNQQPLCDRKHTIDLEVETQKHNSDCFVNNELYSLISSEPVQVVLCGEHNNIGGPIKVYASDQVGNPVAGNIIISKYYKGTVEKYVTNQIVSNQCTELEYIMLSQYSFDQLELYADGPCCDWGISRKVVNDSCRSGFLRKECQHGLSLVLGSSNCKKCSDTYLLLLIPFALAGIALVVFILLFNITVATGTIYGLIFYANVLAASNDNVYMSLPPTNFLTVFISWVTLDLGIETCFYSQMSSQAKALLQLVFPAYLFLLVFLIIILTRYLNLFSKLLSTRNPVATLATLIVLSYSKLIRFIISSLKLSANSQNSFRNLEELYTPDVGHRFTHSIILQLVAAAIILTACGLFTVLLFCSQWLPRCSNWKLMKWTRNTKYNGFMDAFHAPFTPKHRYWVGLLLFALIVHNIIAAMATVSYLPLISALVLPLGRIVLILLNIRVYKIWYLESLEALFMLNILFFVMPIVVDVVRQGTANASMAISFFLFVVILLYHFYKYIITKTSIELKLSGRLKKCKLSLRQPNNERPDPLELLHNTDDSEEEADYEHTPPITVPYTGGEEEEANTNKYHTPPKIVPATRPDQLREPDLDDLAPITIDDYQPAPRANKRQGVTYTVIEPIAAHEEALV